MALRQTGVGAACGAVALLKAFHGAGDLQAGTNMESATPDLWQQSKDKDNQGTKLGKAMEGGEREPNNN